MEGLIPLLLKSMKRIKTLKQYQSLSGLHDPRKSLIDVDDFYNHPEEEEEGYIDYYHYQYTAPTGPQQNARGFVPSDNGGRHGRSKSFNGNNNVFKPRQQQVKQLVRYRSHNSWLSCVSRA